MSDAVRVLRKEDKYSSKIKFFVVEVDSPKVAQEIQRWKGLGSHGLIGTSPEGALKVMIPGHSFGRNEIIAKADELLRSP